MKLLTRRNFLLATKRLACSLLYWGVTPLSLYGKDKISISLPLDNNKNKILIVYASFHGSTAQIAEFMGETLNDAGVTASVKSINDNIDFSSYYGIIMGAPIHRGKWMEEAVDFVNQHRAQFDHLPFACFYTCMSKAKQIPSTETLSEIASYQIAMAELFPDLSPSNIGSFAGMLDYNKCSFLIKLVMWWIMSKNDLEAGDYRDWHAIELWLKDINKSIISGFKDKNI